MMQQPKVTLVQRKLLNAYVRVHFGLIWQMM